MVIYLAGPINKCTDQEAISWREEIKEELSATEHTLIDPMRRDYRSVEADSVEKIVEGDLLDIKDADTILAHAWKPSFGTAMEVWEASQHLDKSVILVAPPQTSPWLLYCADEHYFNLDDAVDRLT